MNIKEIEREISIIAEDLEKTVSYCAEISDCIDFPEYGIMSPVFLMIHDKILEISEKTNKLHDSINI